MAEYSSLNRAQLSIEYLHTNSTTHEFLFGALAEILDNARDAKATKILIETVEASSLRGGFMLSFLDDGQGMSADEAADIITFGKSAKRSAESTMIGMYGNGLKSGSMRIGNDLIVFTKKDNTMTCIFLSRSFHEQEHLEEIIVPMPTFNSQSRKSMAKTTPEKEKHSLELSLILKYSPFKTEADIFRQFDKIDQSGTLVLIYNLKLLDSGQTELDVTSIPGDIVLSNPDTEDYNSDEGLMPERRSFRAYASILYVDPRMRIYINGKKVRTKRLASCLYKPRQYNYSSARFRTRTEAEVTKAKGEANIAENKAKEAESKAVNLEAKLGRGGTREQKAELRKLQSAAADLKKDAQLLKQMADRKQRSLKEPKTLNFIFGLNLENRGEDGVFVYNCSRLIKMYQKVGPQLDTGKQCAGVVGVVDIPYMVLEPTHNKQDFADAKEYRYLLKALGEHMQQFWKDLNIEPSIFWQQFGYTSANWRDPPTDDAKFVRKRAMQVQPVIQCDLCLKWRILPFSTSNVGKDFPEDWVCSNNPDPAHNRCSHPEQKVAIPDGVLKKEVKTKEQREKNLAEEIKKKTEALKQLQKTVTSSKQLKKMDESSTSEDEEESDEETKVEIRKSSPRRTSNPVTYTRSQVSEPVQTRPQRRPAAPAKELYDPPAAKKVKTTHRQLPAFAAAHSKTSLVRSEAISKPSSPPPPPPEEEPVDSQDDQIGTTVNSEASTYLGTKVEAKVDKNWLSGTVIETHKRLDKWKIKFDKYPQDRHDKWFQRNSEDVRVLKLPTDEIPTSSTSNNVNANIQEEVTSGYRTCLRYFLPPQWTMDKDAISSLNTEELASFPLDDFFDHYEQGLRKLVSSFQQEAQTKQDQLAESQTKLSNVRKMISKLLKSINEEFDIDPECDSDRVDDLLSMCVKQALESQH